MQKDNARAFSEHMMVQRNDFQIVLPQSFDNQINFSFKHRHIAGDVRRVRAAGKGHPRVQTNVSRRNRILGTQMENQGRIFEKFDQLFFKSLTKAFGEA